MILIKDEYLKFHEEPNPDPDPKGGNEDVPFKVFNTEEEFNEYTSGIRSTGVSSVYKELGIKSADEFTAMKTAHQQELSGRDSKITQLTINNTLLGAGIPASNIDYALVDMKKANVDVNDNAALQKFAAESNWVVKQEAGPNQTQQVVRKYEGDSIQAQRKRLMFGDQKIKQ